MLSMQTSTHRGSQQFSPSAFLQAFVQPTPVVHSTKFHGKDPEGFPASIPRPTSPRQFPFFHRQRKFVHAHLAKSDSL